MNDIPLIFENDDVLLLDKPAGLIVHADGRTHDASVADWIKQNRPELQGVGESSLLPSGEAVERPGIVHRIDRETSGVLIVAKNQASFLHLKHQFQERLVEKMYVAFTYGRVKGIEGRIDRPLGKSASDFRQWSAGRGARGELRDAITEYEVIEAKEEFSYVRIYPKTGRTHQIRVHFKFLNHPIVCDSLYAAGRPCALGFQRLALHAQKLSLVLPSGERRTFEAPLPPDFLEAERRFQAL